MLLSVLTCDILVKLMATEDILCRPHVDVRSALGQPDTHETSYVSEGLSEVGVWEATEGPIPRESGQGSTHDCFIVCTRYAYVFADGHDNLVAPHVCVPYFSNHCMIGRGGF